VVFVDKNTVTNTSKVMLFYIDLAATFKMSFIGEVEEYEFNTHLPMNIEDLDV